MGLSLQQEFALLPPDVAEEWLAEQTLETLREIAREEWWWVARPEQVPPETAYSIFLYLAGRGSGKTRSGAEWVVERALRYPFTRSGAPSEHLVIAESLDDVRTVCYEGEAGILCALERKGLVPNQDFIYTRSPKPKIVFTATGTRMHSLGADNADSGRGRNNASIWADEIVTWKQPDRIWEEGLRPSLRGYLPGDKPRAYVTTTPKPIPILRKWLAKKDGSVAVSRGSTFDNIMGLPADYLEEMRRDYEGTRIGRQELYGEMLEDLEGALFSSGDIARARVDIGPLDVAYRAMAIDPSLTGSEDGDEMGVVVACRDSDDHMYILDDASVKLVGREAALHCWRVFERWECDVLVYENNLGHAWLHQVLADTYRELQRDGFFEDHTNPPLKPVRSYQGKQLRAEPVAHRCQQGRLHMVGTFPELEKQLVGWDPLHSTESPDRLDALVHVCRFLMEGERGKARIVSPASVTLRGLVKPAPGVRQVRRIG